MKSRSSVFFSGLSALSAMAVLALMAIPVKVQAAGQGQTSQGQGNGMLPGSSSKDPYVVDAAKLDYFDKEQKLVYTGDVIVTQGPSKVHGSVMTVYLDKAGPDGGQAQVRRVEIKGPVTVVQKDKIGTGDTGIFDRADNKWSLIGNVVLTQGNDITRGDKLVYDLATSKAVVQGGGVSTNKGTRVQSVFTPKDNGTK